MRVKLLYFGVLKDLFASGQGEVDLPPGAKVGDLLRLAQAQALRSSPVWKSVAVAVNREYAERRQELREGDEVALLPPVSGGRGRAVRFRSGSRLMDGCGLRSHGTGSTARRLLKA